MATQERPRDSLGGGGDLLLLLPVNLYAFFSLQMRNNHDNIHIFISQSLGFLHHAQTEIRNGAARFMGKSQEMIFPPSDHSPSPSLFPLSFGGGAEGTTD